MPNIYLSVSWPFGPFDILLLRILSSSVPPPLFFRLDCLVCCYLVTLVFSNCNIDIIVCGTHETREWLTRGEEEFSQKVGSRGGKTCNMEAEHGTHGGEENNLAVRS